ncbi:antitoxin MazE family protein [Bartonella sp. DGB2]|uniref:antitoxin MazE family protein n=1 Tax=Bartonella sp. DGB2 TaxID=3388426 RepID=UPI00398FC5D1
MATIHTNERVKKYRAAKRKAGLRLIQIWVPDTRRKDFVEECRRQCRTVTEIEKEDRSLWDFMEQAVMDIEGWHA